MPKEETYRKSVIHLETNPNGTVTADIKNLTFEKLLRITIPFIVGKAKEVYEAASKDPKMNPTQLNDLKLMMYDTLNIAFSNALDMFAPEIEARPNISAEAILKAQDEILQNEMKKKGFLTESGAINPDFEPDELPEPAKQLPGQLSIDELLEANKGKGLKGGK